MGIRITNNLFVSGLFLLLPFNIYAQKSPFTFVSDINKECFQLGDTLTFTIKNLDIQNRGYTIEVTCIDNNLKQNSFCSEIYTAYFNRDAAFFRKMKEASGVRNEKGSGFIIPEFELVPYFIKANGLSIFSFVFTGESVERKIGMKLLIYPSLVDGNPGTPIESKPFYVFAKP